MGATTATASASCQGRSPAVSGSSKLGSLSVLGARTAWATSGGGETQEQASSSEPTQVPGGTQRFVERVRVVYTAAPAA